MDKKIINKIESYKIEVEVESRERIISLGKKQIIKNQMKRHSYCDLFLSTLRFIRVHTWILQFIILMLSIIVASNISSYQPINEVMQSLSFILILSVLFFISELLKSFTAGMWELEQTFKYDLLQHTMMKLLIFGCVDMVLVFFIAFISSQVIALPLFKVLLYLLVPYNIICIILFSLLTVWRNQLHNYVLWLGVGVISVAIIFITNLFDVYALKEIYWIVSYLVTTTLLGYIIYSQARTIRQEVA